MSVTFFAAGDPKGQPRPRAFAMKLGNGKYSARVFDSGTAEGWKSQVALAARAAMPPVHFYGPVRVQLSFMFRRPKSHYRRNGLLMPNAPICHTSKPDADNLAKAVLDCLTQLGRFWHDDSQVSELIVLKFYGETPGVHAVIMARES